MANSSTVNSLLLEIRQRTDRVNATNLDDETELKPWIRKSASHLYELMVKGGDDWYTVSSVLSLVAGQDTYTLPADFRHMVQVYMFYNAGKYRRPIDTFTARQKAGSMYPTYNDYWWMRYKLQRNKIIFTPVPGNSITNAVELNYVPQYVEPDSDEAPFDDVLPNGWEEWVVLDVCIKIRTKQRQDTADMRQDRAAMERLIIVGSAYRDSGLQMMTDMDSPYYTGLGFGAPSGPAVYP